MSLDPILWALKDAPVSDVYERAVLTILAETADEDGCDAFPAVPTIAERALCSPRQVTRVIQELLNRGLIGLGNQSAASYIPLRYRPTVYDVLIPFAWFGNIDRTNEFRARKGRAPITDTSRPPIVTPPGKQRRADYGKPKPARSASPAPIPKSTPEPGTEPPAPEVDYQSPLHKIPGQPGWTASHVSSGVTSSPARGDYQSERGVTSSHPNHPNTNHPLNPPSGGPPPEPPAAAAIASAPKPPRTRPSRSPSKPQSEGDHQKRARERAGQPAVDAITANPNIPLADLRRLISASNPDLYQGQVHGRAATLAASWPARKAGLRETGTDQVNESETSVVTEITNPVNDSACGNPDPGSGPGLDGGRVEAWNGGGVRSEWASDDRSGRAAGVAPAPHGAGGYGPMAGDRRAAV